MKIWITALCAVALLSGCAKKDHEVDAPKPKVEVHQTEAEKLKAEIDALKAEDELVRLKYELAELKKAKTAVDYDLLQDRGGLRYLPNQKKPFTGVAVEKYPNGQKRMENTFKDGKRHGLETDWFENGQKQFEITWKEGEFISTKEWDEDGNPK